MEAAVNTLITSVHVHTETLRTDCKGSVCMPSGKVQPPLLSHNVNNSDHVSIINVRCITVMQEWNSTPSTQNTVRCVTLVHHVSQHLQQQHRNRLTLEEHVNVVDVQWGASIVFFCSSWGHLVSEHNKDSSWKRPRPNRLVDYAAATWTQFLSQST